MAELTEIAVQIETRLREAFDPVALNVTDESHKHAGHAGARPGGQSHFFVEITAATFAGKTRVQIHRDINAALADLLKAQIHALRIKAGG